MRPERGGFALGVVVGLLVGLALALAVALYITKAPVPFVNKVPQRTPEQDQAEVERNKNWDPNAPLAGRTAKAPPPAAAPASAPAAAALATPAAPSAAAASTRDPAAILAGALPTLPAPAVPAPTARGTDPFVYFVQVGAYTRLDEAEQQRARLAMVGQAAKITEREQQGRTVYRVRLGPFATRGEADGLLGRLHESSLDGQIVRVERP